MKFFKSRYYLGANYTICLYKERKSLQGEACPPNPPPPPPSPPLLQLLRHCYRSVPKIMMICYTVPEIMHMTDVIFMFNFGLFFAILPPSPPNNPKNPDWRYHHFTNVHQKL